MSKMVRIYNKFGNAPFCTVSTNFIRSWAFENIKDATGWLVDAANRREDRGRVWHLETVFAREIAKAALERTEGQ